MPNLGWSEMLVIVVVLLLVVGPRELPRILALVAKQLRGARKIAREFQQALESAVYDEEVKEIQQELKSQVQDASKDLDQYGKALHGEVASDVSAGGAKKGATRGGGQRTRRHGLPPRLPTLPAQMPVEASSEEVSGDGAEPQEKPA